MVGDVENLDALKGKKGIKFAHLNCRSFWKKKLEINAYFQSTDILALSETWLSKRYTDKLVRTSNKRFFRNDRITNSKGGVACFVGKKFAEYTKKIDEISLQEPAIETLGLLIDTPKHKNLTVIVVYRPPKQPYKDFFLKLTEIIENPLIQNTEIWILGDINIDVFKNRTPEYKALIDFCLENNLKKLINQLTRPGDNNKAGTSIDQIITNSTCIHESGVLPNLISDHLPIFATRKVITETIKPVSFTGRSYREHSYESLQNYLEIYDWAEFDNIQDDPDLKWQAFLKPITKYLDLNCPIKQMSFRKKKSPWFTQEIIDLIKDRKIALDRHKLTKEKEYLTEARTLRNSISKKLVIAKSEIIIGALEDNLNDPYQFWAEVNRLFNPKECIPYPDFLDELTGDWHRGTDRASYINTYFSKIGELLGEQFDQATLDRHIGYLTPTETPPLSEIILDNVAIRQIIKEVNIHKSSGIKHMSTLVLKESFLLQQMRLQQIFDLSLTSGVFPNSWSVASMVPIPKAGELSDAANWRPISLLPLPSKILEKIVNNQLISHLENHKLLHDNQYGFRPNRGTADAVYDYTKILFKTHNDNKVTLSFYIDFKKAFDSINLDILINKLEYYGINNNHNLLNWFKSYLSNRRLL